MIVHSPESDMPEPFRTYVQQRSDGIARHLAPVVGDLDVQLCPRAIAPSECLFPRPPWWRRRGGVPIIYGAVVRRPEDGLKSVLYRRGFGKDSGLGLVTTSLEAARGYARTQFDRGNRVRVKDPRESDNQGQTTAATPAELDDAVTPLLAEGTDVVVMPFIAHFKHRVSVGRIDFGRVGRYVYVGVERPTLRDGAEVYGGTTLQLFRDSPTLRAEAERRLDIPAYLTRLGMAALDKFAQVAHSAGRVSVDVVEGTADDGSVVRDVIDLTPRVSGASPAEVLAMAAIHRDPGARCVATCALAYSPIERPTTGVNFVDTPTLVINAWVDEVLGP